MPEQQSFSVSLGERSYPIVIGEGLLGGGFDISRYITGPDCVVISNETVAPLYNDVLQKSIPDRRLTTVTIPDGEAHKTLETMAAILDGIATSGAARDTTIIALGGGVVGDMAGFAAASYMRGVNFIQVPTTLLSQVDSSVGGKTGVNLSAGKNLVGAFHQPQLVVIDIGTLSTLSAREFSAGLAEVIKYGVMADYSFFEWLESNLDQVIARDPDALTTAIRRSCELKAEVVAEDERESGRRATLNFGHTFGHAIERSQGYGDWLHGEAVAAGMVMAAKLSGLDNADVVRLEALLETSGLPVAPPAIDETIWREAMGMDKKVRAGQMRFVLLDALGQSYVTSDYDDASLSEILSA